MSEQDRPRYRVSADRGSASRRVRYVESSHPDDGACTICQLDELAEAEEQEAKAASKKSDTSGSKAPGTKSEP
ncbi:hypothetical protein [Pseudomonas saliphila]|uniref:hypothetical protein n=1 Tax=Pseudomonas saliphila TaxID=2586906 RepID=UPI00123B4F99|nr:hypothetical protein [Pseudomonas saliphila]